MIAPRRPGSALLVGLACGAVTVGALVSTAPVGVLPTALSVPAAPAGAPASRSGPPSAPAAPVDSDPGLLPPLVPPPVVPTATTAPPTTVAPPPPAPADPPPPANPAPPAQRAAPEPEPAPRVVAAPAGNAQDQVVALTNEARADAGCAPLRVDGRITAAAQAHSEDMAENGYFSHDSRDGRSFADRMRRAGYDSPGAENIAQGQRDAAEVVRAWLDSPGHRRNIEDCSLTTIGVGLAGEDRFWTQDFGR